VKFFKIVSIILFLIVVLDALDVKAQLIDNGMMLDYKEKMRVAKQIHFFYFRMVKTTERFKY